MNDRHQAGVRLGTWINLGDSPPESLRSGDEINALETNISDVNFYFEGYFAYNILPSTYLELSVGIVNRGSVTVQDEFGTNIGNLLLYPFLLQVKYYPFATVRSKIQPYFLAGGGLYYGRQDVQFTTDPFFDPFFRTDSETDFNYTLGGGIDWLLSDRFGLNLNAKYMPINFSEDLVLINDYGALAITVGVTYLHGGKE
jgi:outer membrane protein W